MVVKMDEIPSRTSVHKAGGVLRRESSGPAFDEAMKTLSAWRKLHQYPLSAFRSVFRSPRFDLRNVILAQRLKRLPSIVGKLGRSPNMGLETMQDIAGMRVVLNDMDDVRRAERYLEECGFSHVLRLKHDYIAEPKRNGYRSLHMVYDYVHRDNQDIRGLKIEVQLRTMVQHSWATVIEVCDIINHSSLKTGGGDAGHEEYFRIVSALFAIEEGTPVVDELRGKGKDELVDMLRDMEARLKILAKLKGIASVADRAIMKGIGKNSSCLMRLDTKSNSLESAFFNEYSTAMAESMYRMLELETRGNNDVFVVMVSLANLRQVTAAYPNYFLDTHGFVGHVGRIIGA